VLDRRELASPATRTHTKGAQLFFESSFVERRKGRQPKRVTEKAEIVRSPPRKKHKRQALIILYVQEKNYSFTHTPTLATLAS